MAIVAALRTTKTQQDSLLPLDRWSSKARYDLVSTAATRRRALALVGLLEPLQHTGFHLAKTGFKGRDTNGNRRKDYIYDLLNCLILDLKSSPAGLVLEFAMWRHFDTKQLELIVSDCMDYPNPRFLKSKTKRRPHLLFLRLEADFAFATNSLNLKIVLDVWFGRDCVCSNIEHLSNIDEK